MPAGRPSAYKPEYCEAVLDWGKQGKSKVWMAAEIGINKDTLYEWESVHPEFSDALTRAMALSQQWWEDKGQSGLDANVFNGGVWSKSMAARFPEDWRDNSTVNLNHNLGSALDQLNANPTGDA